MVGDVLALVVEVGVAGVVEEVWVVGSPLSVVRTSISGLSPSSNTCGIVAGGRVVVVVVVVVVLLVVVVVVVGGGVVVVVVV